MKNKKNINELKQAIGFVCDYCGWLSALRLKLPARVYEEPVNPPKIIQIPKAAVGILDNAAKYILYQAYLLIALKQYIGLDSIDIKIFTELDLSNCGMNCNQDERFLLESVKTLFYKKFDKDQKRIISAIFFSELSIEPFRLPLIDTDFSYETKSETLDRVIAAVADAATTKESGGFSADEIQKGYDQLMYALPNL